MEVIPKCAQTNRILYNCPWFLVSRRKSSLCRVRELYINYSSTIHNLFEMASFILLLLPPYFDSFLSAAAAFAHGLKQIPLRGTHRHNIRNISTHSRSNYTPRYSRTTPNSQLSRNARQWRTNYGISNTLTRQSLIIISTDGI